MCSCTNHYHVFVEGRQSDNEEYMSCFGLQISRKDLLALDFEGVLKYFRVQLPKRYRSEENAKELMHTAVKFKVRLTHQVNSWPSHAIWYRKYWSTLVQVMACCLMAASHYLNQCWRIIHKVLWHSPDSNFTGNAQDRKCPRYLSLMRVWKWLIYVQVTILQPEVPTEY